MPSKILFVEDHVDLATPIKVGLEDEGYTVKHVVTGREAMNALVESWDLVILDLNLPDLSGQSILSNLKQRPDYPPVLILTARSSVHDKVELFKLGCDDYVTKPFAFEELLSRVQALLRRSHRVLRENTHFGEIALDPSTCQVTHQGKSVQLTPKELSMLQLLMSVQGRIVSKKELLHHIWGLKEEPETNFISVHLFNLRKKLSEIDCEEWVVTVRGFGVRMMAPTGGGKGVAKDID